MTLRIFLADDHKILRQGLASLIEKQSNMKVIGEAEDGHQAVESILSLIPNLAIIDVGMPSLNGIEVTRKIMEKADDIKILALSMHSDKRYIMQMIQAGASGYLLKNSAFDELIFAIQSVMKNQIYLSPQITNLVIEDIKLIKHQQVVSQDHILSAREREILQLISEGVSTKEIAFKLNLSTKTIETHRVNIMRKLKIDNLADLIKYAIREGITSL